MSDVLLTLDQVRSLSDFTVLREVGCGSYSNVLLAIAKSNQRKVAIKVCNKAQIVKEKKVRFAVESSTDQTKSVFREKDALKELSGNGDTQPFIVQLFATFQDDGHLYFVLSYATHRDIAQKLTKVKTFDVETTKTVTAELVTAIAYCHSHGILHRDVKPDNILVRSDFHIMLTDFGESITMAEHRKAVESDAKRKCSFVGSHLYVTPEVLRGEPVDETCDYFAVGSILFEFLTGRAPYYDLSEHLVFQRVIKNLFSFPDDFPDANAKDAVSSFLAPRPADRLGHTENLGFEGIKQHAFFTDVHWDQLFQTRSPLSRYYKDVVGDKSENTFNDF